MPGDTEYPCMTKITLPQANVLQAQKETGPIILNFEIPNYNVSNLQIKALKTLQGDQHRFTPSHHPWPQIRIPQALPRHSLGIYQLAFLYQNGWCSFVSPGTFIVLENFKNSQTHWR